MPHPPGFVQSPLGHYRVCVRVPRLRRLAILLGAGTLWAGILVGCNHPAAFQSDPAASPSVGPPVSRVPAVTASVSVPPTALTPDPATPAGTSPSPPAVPPAFAGTVGPVTAADLGASWRPGCPVGPTQLSMLQMSYWGFDGQPHTGTMVVNRAVTTGVLEVFRTLYDERFPIHQMQPVAAYAGNDSASMAADNTSGFNCRYAVAPGPPEWSAHAYGEAIDVNTVENPYLEGGTVTPTAGAAFENRSDYRPGMAVPGGQLVQAFASAGWQWGGRWAATPDYQHFSLTGN